jgi:hypothetical protein
LAFGASVHGDLSNGQFHEIEFRETRLAAPLKEAVENEN